MNFNKFLKTSIIFLIIFGWLLNSFPLRAADGSGTNVVDPNTANADETDKTFEFTFTAAETMDSGEISITIPSGWSAPQGVSTTPGYTTATSTGMIADVFDALDTHAGWSIGSNITISADGADYQEGSYSISASITAAAQAGEKWYFNESGAKDFGSATQMIFWIKSSVSTTAGQLQFEVSDSADLASPLDTVNIPALTAGTWTEVTISLGAARSSVLSYGIKYTTDIGAATVKIDDIRAMFDNADAITNWAVDDSVCTISSEATIKKQGTNSIEVNFLPQSKATKYYWSNATTKSFGSYTEVSFWIRSSVEVVADTLKWEVDNNQLLASPEDSLGFQTLTADTWTYVQVTLGGTRTSVASYGMNQTEKLGTHDEYIDAMAVQVNAAESTTNWTKTSSMVLSTDTTTYHENAASLKNDVAATAGAGDKWWYNLGATDDWSSYTNVGFWIRSTVNTSAGDLQFEYDDSTDLASPIASLDIGALTANTWSYQNLTLTGTRTTINSYGFKYTTDIGAVTINADDILLGPGEPSFSGSGPWDINVRILALANTETITVTYGDNAGGGGGVTVTSSTGNATFTTKSRISDSGTFTNIASSPVITVSAAMVLTVNTTGTQVPNMIINSSDNYVGGAFTFVSSVSQTVSEIIITDTGTVNANSYLSNLKIRYETAGTCTYDGDEEYFNLTGVPFNVSERATATGTMVVGTSQICVYIILDVESGPSSDETLLIQISSSSDVNVSEGSVSLQSTPLPISGTTELQAVISITVDPSLFDYRLLAAGGSEQAINSSEVPNLGDYGILVTNGSNVPVDLFIYGNDATGDETWTLSAGPLQYIHEFVKLDELGDPAGIWTSLDYSGNSKALDTNIEAESGTMEFDLRITTPSSSEIGTIVNIPVTVLAAEAE